MALQRADLGKIIYKINDISVKLVESNKEPTVNQTRDENDDINLEFCIPKPKSAYDIAVDNGFKGTEAEWLESLKAGIGANNIIEFTAGSFSYKEDFTADRLDFNGTMPYGYDFGNGLFCECPNNKNVTLGRGTTYSAVDNETGQTVWFQGFLSNGNSGDILRLKVSKKATITIKCMANDQKGAAVLAIRDEMTNDFLFSTTVQPDNKLYTYKVADEHDDEHDLIISISGAQGLRITDIEWASTVQTNYNIYTAQFMDGALNILRPINISTSDYPALATAANSQTRHFKLDLRKSNLDVWGCGANPNNGITDASLVSIETLDSVIIPSGLEVHSNL